jgi:hypothetical protein
VASLYPLFFIGFLDDVGDKSEEEIEREQEQQMLAASQASDE